MPTATRPSAKPRAPKPNAVRSHPLLLTAQQHWRWLAGGLAVLVVAGLAWALWPGSTPEPPRARQYLEFTACLLTGELGIADSAATPVWDGLQEGSLATRAKVQYLAITGPQTVDNGITFLNSLAQTGCNLIFAVGDLAIATVDGGASAFPNLKFFPIGGGRQLANVSPIAVGEGASLRATVRDTLTSAVVA